MSEHSNIRDENIELLLRHADGLPAPGASFVAETRALMARRAELSAGRGSAARWWRLVGAAVVLVIGFCGGYWLASPDRPDRDGLQEPRESGTEVEPTVIQPDQGTIAEIGGSLDAETRPARWAADLLAPRHRGVVEAGEAMEAPAWIVTGAAEQRRVSLADGSVLYVDAGSRVELVEARTLVLHEGRAFVECSPATSPENPFRLRVGEHEARALGTKLGAETETGRILVTQGHVVVASGSRETHLRAGQQLQLGAGATPRPAPPLAHALHWMRPLLEAAEAPLVTPSDHAGGSILAKDSVGNETRLSLRKLHVDVHIEDGFARTTVVQTYFNHFTWNAEGIFYFPLPSDASISRLAMYVNGHLMEGGMVERQRGREVFETIRHQRKDPALLEWLDGNTFKMRVFPLEARQEKCVLISYTQRLPVRSGRRTYHFPAGRDPGEDREWSFRARMAGGRGQVWRSPSHDLVEELDGEDLVLAGSAARGTPGRDVVVEIAEPAGEEAGHSVRAFELDGAKYLMVRARPDLPAAPRKEARHWILLYEASASRNPLLARVQCDAIRTILEEAEHDDTFHLLVASTRLKKFSEGAMLATRENVQNALAWLDRTHLVGALDLEKAFTGLHTLVADRPEDHAAVLVHVGGGFATLGETESKKLISLVPEDLRYAAVAVGNRWSRPLMEGLARQRGGFVASLNPDRNDPWRRLEIVSRLYTPVLTNLVATAEGTEDRFLILEGSVFRGEQICAVARLSGGELPEAVRITGRLDGGAWSSVVPVDSAPESAGHLPRTWTRLEIDRLVAEDETANRARIVELSKAMHVMSPFTSLLVLENDEMYTQYGVDRGRQDHWAIYPAPADIPVVREAVTTPETATKTDAAGDLRQALDTVRATILDRSHPHRGNTYWQFDYSGGNPESFNWPVPLVEHGQDNPEVLRYWLSAPITVNNADLSSPGNMGVWWRWPEDEVRWPSDLDGRQDSIAPGPRSRLLAGDVSVGIDPSATMNLIPALDVQEKNLIDVTRFIEEQANVDVLVDASLRDVKLSLQLQSPMSWLDALKVIADETGTSLRMITDETVRLYRAPVAALDFSDAPVKDAIRTIARVSGRNIVTSGHPDRILERYLRERATRMVDEVTEFTGSPYVPGIAGPGGAQIYFWNMVDGPSLGMSLDWSSEDILDDGVDIFSDSFSITGGLGAFTHRLPFNLGEGGFEDSLMIDGAGAADLDFRFLNSTLATARAYDAYSLLPGSYSNLYIPPAAGAMFVPQDPSRPWRSYPVALLAALPGGVFDTPKLGRGTIRPWDRVLRRAPQARLDLWEHGMYGDLLGHLPGMRNSHADTLGVLAEEVEGVEVETGAVDGGARELIDRARRELGWKSMTLLDEAGKEWQLQFDGLGRFAGERLVGPGFLERLLCDGHDLWHLYPELGVGAKRNVTRFHRRDLLRRVPWLLPPVEDLAQGANVELSSERTVAIVPLEDPEVAPLRVELHFSEQGRLQSRTWVRRDSSQVRAAVTYAEDGGVVWTDSDGTELSSFRLKVEDTPEPDLIPASDGLVVLPLPYRSRSPQEFPDEISEWSEDERMANLSSLVATRNHLLWRHVHDHFLDRGDDRIGLFTLLLSTHGPWDLDVAQHTYNGQKTALFTPPEGHAVSAYLGHCLTAQQNPRWLQSAEQVESLQDGPLKSLLLQQGLLAQASQGVLPEGLSVEFVASHVVEIIEAWRDPQVVRELLAQIANRATPSGLREAVVGALELDVPSSAHGVRYELAALELSANELDRARDSFASLYEQASRTLRVPPLDAAFMRAFQADQNRLHGLLRRTAAARVESGDEFAVLLLAHQARLLGQLELAVEFESGVQERLADAGFEGRLLFLEHFLHSGEVKRALALSEELLAEDEFSHAPWLCRIAAQLCAGDQPRRSARFLQHALVLETGAREGAIDMQLLRNEFRQLMARYEAIGRLLGAVEAEASDELIAEVVGALDRWRQLETDPTEIYEIGSRSLHALGADDLAWKYLYSLVDVRPGESGPWMRVATVLQSFEFHEEADHAYANAFDLERTNAEILWQRAANLEQSGLPEQARALYLQISESEWQPRFQSVKLRAQQKLE